MVRCPYCAEEIQDAAVKCKHCGEWIDPSKRPIPAVAKEPRSPLRRSKWTVGSLNEGMRREMIEQKDGWEYALLGMALLSMCASADSDEPPDWSTPLSLPQIVPWAMCAIQEFQKVLDGLSEVMGDKERFESAIGRSGEDGGMDRILQLALLISESYIKAVEWRLYVLSADLGSNLDEAKADLSSAYTSITDAIERLALEYIHASERVRADPDFGGSINVTVNMKLPTEVNEGASAIIREVERRMLEYAKDGGA